MKKYKDYNKVLASINRRQRGTVDTLVIVCIALAAVVIALAVAGAAAA
jgi:hypothetical protein